MPEPINRVKTCIDCDLHRSRNFVVAAVGNVPSDLMIIGEAPKHDENQQGVPFVGEEGKILDAALREVQLDRNADVVLAYTVKCIPTDGRSYRSPVKAEIESCRHHLENEILQTKPKVILALGAGVSKALIGKAGAISKIRGIPVEVEIAGHSCIVIPTYHPGFVLKNDSVRGAKFQDFVGDIWKARATIDPTAIKSGTYHLIKDPIDFHDFMMVVEQWTDFAFDIETTGLDPLSGTVLGLSFCGKRGEAYYLPLNWCGDVSGSPLPAEEVRAMVKPYWDQFAEDEDYKLMTLSQDDVMGVVSGLLLSDQKKTTHHGKFDVQFLKVSAGLEVNNWAADSMTMVHLCDENRRQYKLKTLLDSHYPDLNGYDDGVDKTNMAALPLGDIAVYAGKDADGCYRLTLDYFKKMQEAGLVDFYRKFVHPTTLTLTRIETNGIHIDQKWGKELAVELEVVAASDLADVRRLSGREELNLNSSKQLSEYFFVDKGYPITKTSLKTGAPSTDASVLEYLADTLDDPVAGKILSYRAAEKILSTYLRKMPEMIRSDGRIHASFHQHTTVTGRLCVAGDTLLETDQGAFEISKLNLTKTPNIRIITHEGHSRRILHKYYKGREQMFNVVLEDGREIKCTAGHRFLTPDGWRCLSEFDTMQRLITVQKDFYSFGQPVRGRSCQEVQQSVDACADRGCVCSSDTGEEVDWDTGGEATLCEQSGLFCFNDFVSAEIPGTNQGNQASQVFNSFERKQTWGKNASGSSSQEASVEEAVGSGLSCLSHSQRIEYLRMVCTAEHHISSVGRNRSIALSDGTHRLGLYREVGAFCSGIKRSCQEILRRPTRILQKVVYRVLSCVGITLVCEVSSKAAGFLYRAGGGSKGPHYIQQQPVGDDVVSEITAKRHSPYSEQSILQKFSRRFFFSGYSSFGRGRWRFPSKRQGHNGAGYCERISCSSVGVQDCSIHGQGCEESSGLGSSGDRVFTTSRIRSIKSVGVLDVWDIEVEEDHSYIAHGFVNHNSSSNPNLQNIPVRSEQGLRVRGCFTASPGNSLICCDYSQMELRVIAWIAQDVAMLRACNAGVDLHAATARLMWNIPEETEVPADQRYLAKTINFAIAYGADARRVAEEGKISLVEAKRVVAIWYESFPEVKAFIDRTHKKASIDGFVVNPFGRVRRLPILKGVPLYRVDKFIGEARRQSVNSIIQGAASDMVVFNMNRLQKELDDSGYSKKMVLLVNEVHDAIYLDCPKSLVDEVVILTKRILEMSIAPVDVALKIDIHVVDRWSEAV